MTDIQVTLCTTENYGDHAGEVRLAHVVEPDETVEHLLHRLMRAGEFAEMFRSPEPLSAWIELRYVHGTLPDPPKPASTDLPF